MKKIFKTNIFWLLLSMTVTTAVFNACGKDDDKKENDPCLPIKDKITALQTDSIRQAQNVRTTLQAARTFPEDISGIFDGAFIRNNPQNIVDTATLCNMRILELRNQYGQVMPKNNESINALFDATTLFLGTCDNLTNTRQELSVCK